MNSSEVIKGIIHKYISGRNGTSYATDEVPLHQSLAAAYKMKPEIALSYLNKRGDNIITTDTWDALTAEEHSKSFTVAKVYKADILQKIFTKLRDGYDSGKSLGDIKKDLTQFLPESRIRTIVQTNIQSSYMRGRYNQQMLAAKQGMVYWQFIHTNHGKESGRDDHDVFHLKVFRYDDPIWAILYPPRGFNCACRVRAMTEKELKDLGIEVSKGSDFSFTPENGWESGVNANWVPDLSKYSNELKNLVINDLKQQKDAPEVVQPKPVTQPKPKTAPQPEPKPVPAEEPKVEEVGSNLDVLSDIGKNFKTLKSTKEFFSEYSDATANMTESQKTKMLQELKKTFPNGFPTKQQLIDIYTPKELQNKKKPILKFDYDEEGKILTMTIRGEGISYNIERNFSFKYKQVDHTMYALNDSSIEGKGVHKSTFVNELAFYRQSKFEFISTHANVDAGKYAWIKYGFDFNGSMQKEEFFNYIRDEGLINADLCNKAVKHKSSNPEEIMVSVGIDLNKLKNNLDSVSSWDGLYFFKDDEKVSKTLSYCGLKAPVIAKTKPIEVTKAPEPVATKKAPEPTATKAPEPVKQQGQKPLSENTKTVKVKYGRSSGAVIDKFLEKGGGYDKLISSADNLLYNSQKRIASLPEKDNIRRSVELYSSFGYSGMNNYLRGYTDYVKEHEANMANIMKDTAFTDRLSKKTTLFRGQSLTDIENYESLSIGDDIKLKGFTSTSVNPETAGYFLDKTSVAPVMLVINAPAGSKFVAGNKREREVIFNHDSKFKLKAAEKYVDGAKNETLVLYLDYVE